MIVQNSSPVRPLERDGIRSVEKGIKSFRVQADLCEEFGIEHDPCLCEEALSYHPPEWDSREGVTGFVLDRTTADIYG